MLKLSKKEAQKLGLPVAENSKHNSRITIIDGIRFRSAKEADYYTTLKMMQKCGDLKFFLRQVPFYLPGGTKYIIDFIEFWEDGRIVFTDVKGRRLPAYIRNRKQVEALYPVKINEA